MYLLSFWLSKQMSNFWGTFFVSGGRAGHLLNGRFVVRSLSLHAQVYLVRGDSVHVTNISNWGRSTITHQPHHKWFQWKGDRQDWTKEQMCWKSMLAGFMEWLMKSLRFWFKWSAHIRRKAPPANLPFTSSSQTGDKVLSYRSGERHNSRCLHL